MARREFKYNKFQQDKLKKVQEVLKELDAYKPLTLRQIYYQLVGRGYIANNKSQYNTLSQLLKWARINGLVNWNDIEDRVRVFENLTGSDNKEQFVEQEIKYLLEGYQRNLLQSQSVYLECWVEKDALRSIFVKIARQYSVPVVACRGFSSATFLHDYKERISYCTDKTPIMLYFGDFDPSGIEMFDAIKTTLVDEMKVTRVEFKWIALLKSDIKKYNLPHDAKAIKKSDTRAKKHIATYGNLAAELDALPPDVLEKIIANAIETEIDLHKFEQEKKQHSDDLQEISLLKSDTEMYIDSRMTSHI